MAVGAGGAFTGGVNRLPPLGSIDFSVGATDDAGGAVVAVLLVVVVVVVGVLVSGAFAPCPQAVSVPTAMIAPMPAVAARRRVNRADLMLSPIWCLELNYIVQKTATSTRKPRETMGNYVHCRALTHRGTDDEVQLAPPVLPAPIPSNRTDPQ
jgi:hypothetical protein